MNSINRNAKIKEINLVQTPHIIEKPQPTILRVECNREIITTYLSDSRIISIPTG